MSVRIDMAIIDIRQFKHYHIIIIHLDMADEDISFGKMVNVDRNLFKHG
jgi:hypothetical protein